MPDVVDDDTLQAVKARWQADHATLPALFERPAVAGRLKQDPAGKPLTMPYAQVECAFKGNQSAGTGGAWHDHRTVSIRVWGTKDQAAAGGRAVLAAFNLRTVLDLPSGAKFMRWWPDGANTLTEDKDTARGKDVWVFETKADVWSIRLY